MRIPTLQPRGKSAPTSVIRPGCHATKTRSTRLELLAAACLLALSLPNQAGAAGWGQEQTSGEQTSGEQTSGEQASLATPASAAQPQAQQAGLFGASANGLFAESEAAPVVKTFTVTTNADSGAGSLRQAILDANAYDAAAPANASVIDFSGAIGTITLLSPLQPLNYNAAKNVFLRSRMTIDGSGATGTVTVNGNAAQRVFFAGGGQILVRDLTIANGLALGGRGTDGGGGGLGAGGGLLVNTKADVTLQNVVFSANAATGGAGSGFTQPVYVGVGGGGGGLFGNGGTSIGGGHQAGYGGYGGGGGAEGYYLGGNGGGPGGGVGDVNGLGNPGKLFGGAAGGGYYTGSGGTGGDFGGGGGGCLRGEGGLGGFGGGGGSGLYGGGGGGFGGGGGGASASATDITGPGGFAGGHGGYSYNGFGYASYGGGGGALGGAVFVRSGGTLSLRNGGLAGGTVTPGLGGVAYHGKAGAQPGQGIGSGMFLMNGVTTLWQVDARATVNVADDLAGSADPRNGTGISVLKKTGNGTLILGGNNSFGGLTLAGGTLEAAAATSTGSGTITFQSGVASTLKLDVPAKFTNVLAGLATNDRLDLPSFKYSHTEHLAYSGTSTAGTLTVTDGKQTAAISLSGTYKLADFQLKADGHGGSLVLVTLTE